MIPIEWETDKSNVDNHHPISIALVLSKTMVKVVNIQLKYNI